MTPEEEPESYDFYEDEEEPALPDSDVIEKLRDTLTHDMAEKAYRCRYGEKPEDAELETFMDELIGEHYEQGFDEWNEEFLYYD